MSLHGRSLMDTSHQATLPDGAEVGASPDKIPVGVWLRLRFRDQPPLVVFTYVDRREGFSAQGYPQRGAALHRSGRITIRLPIRGVSWEVLSEEAIAQLGLETRPTWVEQLYGEQPATGMIWGIWRDHPKLRGLLNPDAPDELEVLIHEGGPSLAPTAPESLIVRITGVDGDVFTGQLVESPRRLATLVHLDAIRFIVPDAAKPMLVTEKYLHERDDWIVGPCARCGMTELFDAPSDLTAEAMASQPFTTDCCGCGGPMNVRHRATAKAAPTPQATAKKWWQFWS